MIPTRALIAFFVWSRAKDRISAFALGIYHSWVTTIKIPPGGNFLDRLVVAGTGHLDQLVGDHGQGTIPDLSDSRQKAPASPPWRRTGAMLAFGGMGTGGALSRTIAGMTYLFSLCLLILALWLASEIAGKDLSSPASKDPYRLDRWRKGEGNPDQ